MTGGRLPLWRGAAEAAGQAFRPAPGGVWGGNAGLWFDKFCDRWADDFVGLADEQAKRDWIATVIHPRDPRSGAVDATRRVKVGDARLLEEHDRRRAGLVRGLGAFLTRFVLEGRFVSGLGRTHPVENGFAWHHNLGVPYLAGSGIKGMVRAWAECYEEVAEADITRIFGPRPASGKLSVGSVVFLDALPTAPVQLVCEVMTPHYGPWYQSKPETGGAVEPPADWHSPTPIPFLAVESGTIFTFAIMPRTAADPATAEADCLLVRGWLAEALHWIGAGAKTPIGFGRFRDAAPHPAQTAKPFVDGEPVRILRREGPKTVVEFLDSGDIETVSPDRIEYA